MDIIPDVFSVGRIDPTQLLRVTLRLIAATMLGAVVGSAQAKVANAIGLRVYVLVALAAALFVLMPAEAGLPMGDLSWAIQGVVVGSGIVAAGTMLRRTVEREIDGLPVAAGLWLTAAIGLAMGLGQLWIAIFSSILGWTVLVGVGMLEQQITKHRARSSDTTQP